MDIAPSRHKGFEELCLIVLSSAIAIASDMHEGRIGGSVGGSVGGLVFEVNRK